MTNEPATSLRTTDRGSSPAEPFRAPSPTIWPAALGLAATLLIWGLISSLIITIIGTALFVVSIGNWIKEIRHERKS